MNSPRRKGRIPLRLRRAALYLAVVAIVVWTLGPVTWLAISSITPYNELISDRATHWFPRHPTFANFQVMFDLSRETGERFVYAIRNSMIVASSVTAICLVAGTLAAYALARLPVRGKKPLVLSLMSIRMLPTIALVIPFFVIVSYIDYGLMSVGSSFHLFDTKLNLVILYTTFILGFVIWIMRGFFLTIPLELEEAARIDGCTRLQALRHVVLPLCAPGLVATGILSFLLAWDEFLLALIFTRSNNAITLPLFIAELGSQYITAYDQISAAGVMAAIPPVVLALLFQRFIVQGLTSGSVKG
ncbi:MAG: carbohydrate ABC transporter permease [Bacillota bacterium]|nr:carbohydrate ABC transporter permease [Bacillota bacterium]